MISGLQTRVDWHWRAAIGAGVLIAVFAAVSVTPGSAQSKAQPKSPSTAQQVLIERAHSLDAMGKKDIAAQSWRQVLLSDPRNVEALEGLARYAVESGNSAEAHAYLNRLRQIDPSNPNVARILATPSNAEQNARLTEAGSLAKAGQYEQAMNKYRQAYGEHPPDGEIALGYYETEAAVADGLTRALAGLRGLVARYPARPRYAIALGRILTYNAKTRAEGERLLHQHPHDATAQAALRQSLLWDSGNFASASGIREYLKSSPDEELAARLAETEARQSQQPMGLATTPEEQAAYSALTANRLDEAQMRFEEILKKQPSNGRALAGIGFVRMKQQDFAAATLFLEQAEQSGLHGAVLSKSLDTARFWATMAEGTAALKQNDLKTAESRFAAALAQKPSSPEALAGLAGTRRRQGRDAEAVDLYRQAVGLQPESPDSWRGLVASEIGADRPQQALATVESLPKKVKAALIADPEYMRLLATAYTAVGEEKQAEAVLAEALSLPFPEGGRGMTAEKQLAFAALLAQARHYAQAAGLYLQVIAKDSANGEAWQGLVRIQHAAGKDAEALASSRQMPTRVLDAALGDAGFLATLASIYQQTGELEEAQSLLERSARLQKTGQWPVSLQLQLASIHLARKQPLKAYAIYRAVAEQSPELADAWEGVLASLHQAGQDREALQQLVRIPESVRMQLAEDAVYLQSAAAIYSATGDTQRALVALRQVEALYRRDNVQPPATVEIQSCWLLYNAKDDRALYPTLMRIGAREDLTNDQRREVQTIWASWSVRRAGEAIDAGRSARALEILNAAEMAFPGNPAVSRALAGGFLRAGKARQALEIYKTLDLAGASSADYQGAVGAALAAQDKAQAEIWLREALSSYANDPSILAMAARYEQARGDPARAAEYWRAALAAMPQETPANKLARTLAQGEPAGAKRPDLASLLDPARDPASSTSASVLRLPGDVADARRSSTLMEAEPEPLDSEQRQRTSGARQDPDDFRAQGRAPAVGPSTQKTPKLGDYSPQSTLVYLDPARRSDAGASSDLGVDSASAKTSIPQVIVSDSGMGFVSAAEQASTLTQQIASIHPVSARLDTTIAEKRGEVGYLPLARSSDYDQTGEQTAPTSAGSSLKHDAIARNGTAAQYSPAPGEPSRTSPNRAPEVYSPATGASILSGTRQVTDAELTQHDLPPLRGSMATRAATGTPADPRQQAEAELAAIDGGYSPWMGGSGVVTHRSGDPGFENLTALEAPFEFSAPLGTSVRATVISRPVLLDSGTADGNSIQRLGSLTQGTIFQQQNAAGIGGELQLSGANYGASVGYTPYGFLVSNFIGRVSARPSAGPMTLSFARDSIKDTQLSYAGLRDPGSASAVYPGTVWGGIIANAGNAQFSKGDAASGYYLGGGGQYIRGQHVVTNNRYDGTAGAYWQVHANPEQNLTVGMSFFGMHYAHNQSGFSYGQGGYFSPDVYLLATVPFEWVGRYASNFRYRVTGGLGVQGFEEASAPLFPLDPALQTANNNPWLPTRTSVGGHYDLKGEGSYRIADHWFVGGNLNFNNSRSYNTQTVGFFLRYLFRQQGENELAPTGMFPRDGLRPLLVP